MKVLKNDQVKIQPKTPKTYSNIVKGLKLKKTEFHTYKPKNERNFKVVLKNIHGSTDVNDLKAAIEKLGHVVQNIWNVRHRELRKPLPIFFIDFKSESNNKDIYNVKSLLQCRSCLKHLDPSVKSHNA